MPAADVAAVCNLLEAFFATAGTETRYQLAPGERAIDFVLAAAWRALAAAGRGPADVDLVIYAGVGRGWVEPAMATAVQAELGLRDATSFDVLDACASWLRALQIAQGYLDSGSHRCCLIVNCECGLYRAYGDWGIAALEELPYRAAMYTIGEAATATVVTAENPGNRAYFRFRTFPEYFRLCMVPARNVADFLPGEMDARYVPDRFFAQSRELFMGGLRRVVEVFMDDPTLRDDRYDICLGHCPSERASSLIAARLGVAGVALPTHRLYGNTVSASIPLGMSLALESGRLRRGQKALLVVGAAGITVGFAKLTF